ncbi:MAG: leucine-rich repeat domain-containing protein [Aureispira sp.]|nr:leucine-rich repeat domain-containing protein [Aureispira sp.]
MKPRLTGDQILDLLKSDSYDNRLEGLKEACQLRGFSSEMKDLIFANAWFAYAPLGNQEGFHQKAQNLYKKICTDRERDLCTKIFTKEVLSWFSSFLHLTGRPFIRFELDGVHNYTRLFLKVLAKVLKFDLLAIPYFKQFCLPFFQPYSIWDYGETNYYEVNFNSLKLTDEELEEVMPVLVLINPKKITLITHQLTDLPNDFGKLTNITDLNLAEGNFELFPEPLTKLTRLEHLNLRDNPLKNMEEGIGNWTELRTLSLENCSVYNLPESIGNLTKLETLNLRYNKLIQLPESIGNLQALKEMRTHQNRFIDLPDSIIQLKKLELLRMLGSRVPKERLNYIRSQMPHTTIYG